MVVEPGTRGTAFALTKSASVGMSTVPDDVVVVARPCLLQIPAQWVLRAISHASTGHSASLAAYSGFDVSGVSGL